MVVAYGKILPQWLLDLPRWAPTTCTRLSCRGIVGRPPSLGHCEWRDQDRNHNDELDAGMDTGDMLLQQEISIEAEDTCASIHDRLAAIGAELMLKTVEGLEKGTAKTIPQDPALATYAPMLKKSDGHLDWSRSAVSIHNRIRAFNPWPGTYTQLEGQTLRIWKAQPVKLRANCRQEPSASQLRSRTGSLWNRLPSTEGSATGEPKTHFGSRFSPRHSLGKTHSILLGS